MPDGRSCQRRSPPRLGSGKRSHVIASDDVVGGGAVGGDLISFAGLGTETARMVYRIRVERGKPQSCLRQRSVLVVCSLHRDRPKALV